MPRSNLKIEFLGLAFSIFIYCAICFAYLPGRIDFQYLGAFVDDSYILLRYAEHLAMGEGFVWNLGDNPAEGLSSLAWATLLAIAVLTTGLSFPLAALYLGIAFGLLCLIAVWAIARYSFSERDRKFAAISPVLLAITPIFARHAISGMETIFVVFIYCLLMLLMVSAEKHSTARTIGIGVFGGLLYLARPEAPLFGLLIPLVAYAVSTSAGHAEFSKRAILANRSKILLFTSVFFAVTLVVCGIRWVYFDSLFPLPAYMKLGLTRHNLVSQTTYIVTQWAFFFSYFAYLVLPILLWIACKPKYLPHEIAVIFAAAAFLLYMLQVVPVMNFSLRYFAPLLGAIVVLASRSMVFLARRLTDNWRGMAAVLVAFFFLAVGASAGNMNAAKTDRDNRPHDKAVALALAKVPGITLSYSEAGIIPFYSKHRFIDCAGLNDKFIAKNRYREGFEKRYWPYVQQKYGLPDVHFKTSPECINHARLELLDEDARRTYEEVKNVCGRTLYVLKTSPKYSDILKALSEANCPASAAGY